MQFFHKFRPYYQYSFFSKLSFLFSTQSSKMSLNMCKFVTNCAMPKIGWQSDLHGKMNLNLLKKKKKHRPRESMLWKGVGPLLTNPPTTSSNLWHSLWWHQIPTLSAAIIGLLHSALTEEGADLTTVWSIQSQAFCWLPVFQTNTWNVNWQGQITYNAIKTPAHSVVQLCAVCTVQFSNLYLR